MSEDNYELEVNEDGTFTQNYDDPVDGEVEDLPEPPRVVTGWKVGVFSTPDGTDKALMLTVETKRGPVVLAMAPAYVGQLIDNLLSAIRREL